MRKVRDLRNGAGPVPDRNLVFPGNAAVILMRFGVVSVVAYVLADAGDPESNSTGNSSLQLPLAGSEHRAACEDRVGMLSL